MTERRAAARRRRKEAGIFRQASRRSLAIVVEGALEDYDRARHLPRLSPVGPDDIADDSPAGRRAILSRLARALRAERTRGRAGHWTYDLNRHLGLKQAYAAERARLRAEAARLRAMRPRDAETAKPPPEAGGGSELAG
jgi:hypothetical protein